VKKSADDGGNLEKETKKFDKTRYKQYFLPKKDADLFSNVSLAVCSTFNEHVSYKRSCLGLWWNVQWFPKPAGRHIHMVVVASLSAAQPRIESGSSKFKEVEMQF